MHYDSEGEWTVWRGVPGYQEAVGTVPSLGAALAFILAREPAFWFVTDPEGVDRMAVDARPEVCRSEALRWIHRLAEAGTC